MLEIRKSGDRGTANHGWLDSRHTFSFANYYDPRHTGFGPLLVINEDRVLPSRGFGTHGHSDMEIISYVLDGALEHKDSMGTGSVIRYGDVQRMSAGTGVQHSEYNHSSQDAVHFLQIWIEPNEKGISPSYEQKYFDVPSKSGQLRLIVSPDGRDGSVKIHQNAMAYASILNGADEVSHALAPGRSAYLHMARGELVANDVKLSAGDGLKVRNETSVPLKITLSHANAAEALLFDLPY